MRDKIAQIHTNTQRKVIVTSCTAENGTKLHDCASAMVRSAARSVPIGLYTTSLLGVVQYLNVSYFQDLRGCMGVRNHQAQAKVNDEEEEEEDSKDEPSDDDADSDEDFMKGFLFAPDDIQDFIFALKDDVHGIGYRGLDSSRSILGGHVTLFEEPVTSKSRRQGIRGHVS